MRSGVNTGGPGEPNWTVLLGRAPGGAYPEGVPTMERLTTFRTPVLMVGMTKGEWYLKPPSSEGGKQPESWKTTPPRRASRMAGAGNLDPTKRHALGAQN